MKSLRTLLGCVIVSGALLASAILRGEEAAPTKETADKVKVVLLDDFDGKLKLDWKPIHHDPLHYSLTKIPGALTITTQHGSMYGAEKMHVGAHVKNLFLIKNPLDKDGDFTITTSVSGFTPQIEYQQAGLVIYDDDDNYLKWGYEYNWSKGSGQVFAFVPESKAKPELIFSLGEQDLKRYWLRMTKRGQHYTYASSVDGEKFTVRGGYDWKGEAKRIGLIAKNGGNRKAPQVDAAFEFFEFRALPPGAEKNDDAKTSDASATPAVEPASQEDPVKQ